MRTTLVAGVAACLLAAGCGGSSTPPVFTPTGVHGSPDIKGLLAMPIASPRVCPSTVDAAASGRTSPWSGTVDVSVFAKPSDSAKELKSIESALRRQPLVVKEFFESQSEAYEEFQRLYTCSARISAKSLPASFRLVLPESATEDQRDALVRKAQLLPGVSLVSCDPRDPCVNVVRSVDPSITKQG